MQIKPLCPSSKFLHGLVPFLFRPEFIDAGTFALQGVEVLSIGALSYGYPALLMLRITWTDSQNPVKAFGVY